jgi:hypothetical protein
VVVGCSKTSQQIAGQLGLSGDFFHGGGVDKRKNVTVPSPCPYFFDNLLKKRQGNQRNGFFCAGTGLGTEAAMTPA